jgi:alpha-aminoadipate carrier protein LysW
MGANRGRVRAGRHVVEQAGRLVRLGAHMATCPECDSEIEIDEYDVDKGDILSCPECGSNLEVTSLSPVELDLAPDEDEEEEEEDEEDDEEDEGYDEGDEDDESDDKEDYDE